MKKAFLLLFFILCVATGFRFYKLGDIPISPDWDEVALGYNAYSIFKTGRDEYGTFLPLVIRSFDDYKPPLYTYLAVPSVGLFGLSPWSTRLPSAIMGVFAVFGVYFFVYELFKRKDISLLSSFLLAISPWHIQFSRIAFESNIGVTINIWAITAFLISLRRKIFLPISAFLFGLGLYAYHSERVFLPLIVLLLLIVYRKEIFTKEKRIAILSSSIIGLIFVIPLAFLLFGSSGLLRLTGTSSFTDKTGLLSREITKLQQDKDRGDEVGALLDNRRIVYAKTVFSGYLSHFSLRWLFLTGDNPRHHAPDMGLLYVVELPFLLYGIYWINKFANKTQKLLLFGWLLLAPIAASPTTGLPHAVRTLIFLPTLQIFTAIGLLKSKWLKYVFVLCIVGNILYFCNMYFVQMNSEVSQYWQYGYKEAVLKTEALKNDYQKIVVSTSLEQSYMFFLFYTKYDPIQYLAAGGTKSGSFQEEHNRFDKYEFRKIDWSKEIRDGSILYVGAPGDMPHGNIANIKFLDGTPAIEIADRPNGAP